MWRKKVRSCLGCAEHLGSEGDAAAADRNLQGNIVAGRTFKKVGYGRIEHFGHLTEGLYGGIAPAGDPARNRHGRHSEPTGHFDLRNLLLLKYLA